MSNLKLAKFIVNDFELYYSLVSNEKVMAMITEKAIPLEVARERFNKMIKQKALFDKYGSFKVFNNATNEFLSSGNLTINKDNDNEAEIGYMLLPKYWGKGFGSEIANALVEKAKEDGLKKLTAIIDPNNVASRKILISLGFHSLKVCEIDGLPGEILYKDL
ncbi:N-acetyltransferase [Rummeliibacillus sp. TYF005]|uniref:GNAT family N-acetyltransferase n=1 Tax=Rummeliibacillus sp. TYF005 TaxID=2058214 RepID=UPI000F52C381|nr:GNAT family N-acetyltransferase [Rummeliibacillus sp. TYF005]RPJ96345.1 N-acetyltransferase [Rummeliibacillus sp. TYF005]